MKAITRRNSGSPSAAVDLWMETRISVEVSSQRGDCVSCSADTLKHRFNDHMLEGIGI